MMRIDSIAERPDRAGRHLVRFSDGSVMRLYRRTVEDFGLYPGLELDENQLVSLRESAGATSAKMRAVRIVTASNVSKADLQERLIRKGEDPEQAMKAVQWMEDLSFVDDERVARQIAEQCARKGYGAARVRQMFYEKKIPKKYWEMVLEDYPDQTEKIIDHLRTHLTDISDQRQLKRAVDALLRKGHAYGQIRKALDMLKVDMEEFPEDS